MSKYGPSLPDEPAKMRRPTPDRPRPYDPYWPYGGCIAAPEDKYPPDRLRWYTGRCDTAFAGLFITDDWPHPATGGLHEDGSADLITVHPTGLDQTRRMGSNAEICRYEVGALALNEDGEGIGVFCNHPHSQEKDNTIGYPFVAGEDNGNVPSGLLAPGDMYFVLGYRWPPRMEVHYHSHQVRCGGPI